MTFFLLALVALIFGLLGFLVHAFYFSKRALVESFREEIQYLERTLEIRREENADAQEEMAETRILLQSLKRQLEEKNKQVASLQDRARSQEEKIGLLEREASEIRLSLAGTEERRKENPAPKPEESASEPVPQTKERKIPLWKDNLNNILDMLNKIDNEGKE